LLGGGLITAAFFAGRLTATTAVNERLTKEGETTDQVNPSSHSARHQHGRDLQPLLRGLAVAQASKELTAAIPDEEAKAEELRQDRAAFLLAGVFRQLEDQRRRRVEPAEARANAVVAYLAGVMRGAAQADPRMRAAFSTKFTNALCDGGMPADETLSVAHMAMIFPDIATPKGFECFFKGAKEDIATWTMLDAWKHSGLEKSAAIAQMEATATDERTKRRFLSDAAAVAQRMPHVSTAD